MKIAKRKDILGPMYCKKPNLNIDILVAAELNHKRGITVIRPAKMSKSDVKFIENVKLFSPI